MNNNKLSKGKIHKRIRWAQADAEKARRLDAEEEAGEALSVEAGGGGEEGDVTLAWSMAGG